MRKNQTSLTSVLALLVLAAAVDRVGAQAKGPAFDCGKAEGEVELLICRDEGLAALDRALDEVYKAAVAKARDDVPQFLRTEQRGWVKGRNECWKGKDGTGLTATGQAATNVRECVEGSYRIRISELQATMRLVPAKGPVFFACEGNPANEVVATFFETDPPTARLERGDKTVTAWLVPAGSGSKYEGQNVEFWTKGKDAVVSWLGAALKCQSK
ncbi:MAG TPA: MliC family protein [Vicinamibacteria bacterium]